MDLDLSRLIQQCRLKAGISQKELAAVSKYIPPLSTCCATAIGIIDWYMHAVVVTILAYVYM